MLASHAMPCLPHHAWGCACSCRYCECFASGRYCESCNCVTCLNNRENEATRQSAVEAILERNPNAFRPKIQVSTAGTRQGSGYQCC